MNFGTRRWESIGCHPNSIPSKDASKADKERLFPEENVSEETVLCVELQRGLGNAFKHLNMII